MAATYINDKKLSLKIMVDMKAKKVVFAEAEKDFVDFIFNLVSLPLSTVTKVLQLNGENMVGSLGVLSKSIENLDTRYLEPNINNRSVLNPKATVTVPLLSLHDCCFSRTKDYVENNMCKCNWVTEVKANSYSIPTIRTPTYVKEGVVYMVMDNLEVKPMSIALIKSCVKNFDDLEAKEVEVGLQEGLAILKASLETKTVLTTVFLKKM